jgi:hypothetical protein
MMPAMEPSWQIPARPHRNFERHYKYFLIDRKSIGRTWFASVSLA